jgi:hypothetical protein
MKSNNNRSSRRLKFLFTVNFTNGEPDLIHPLAETRFSQDCNGDAPLLKFYLALPLKKLPFSCRSGGRRAMCVPVCGSRESDVQKCPARKVTKFGGFCLNSTKNR